MTETAKKIDMMLDAGINRAEIAREVGISKTYVTTRARKKRMPIQKQEATAKIQTAILDADRSRRGWQTEIARKMGLHRQTVSRTYKAMMSSGKIL